MYSSLSEAAQYIRVILTFINSVLLLNGRNNGLWRNSRKSSFLLSSRLTHSRRMERQRKTASSGACKLTSAVSFNLLSVCLVVVHVRLNFSRKAYLVIS